MRAAADSQRKYVLLTMFQFYAQQASTGCRAFTFSGTTLESIRLRPADNGADNGAARGLNRPDRDGVIRGRPE
jgi:hypothetical protein